MDGVHDMGGMHGFGAVVRPGGEAPYHDRWEARVFALHLIVDFARLGAGPGGRATREEMEPAAYLGASYYERWLYSAERRLERSGAISPGEVEEAMRRIEAGRPAAVHHDPGMAQSVLGDLRTARPMAPAPSQARFAAGQRVRVRRIHPPGHTRCPRYVRGVAGIVEAVRGADRLPDRAVYGEPAEPEAVYSVAFASGDLWGPSREPGWEVLLDLWESYLEEA